MKLVVDTNVLVSGIFWRGAPRMIVEAWKDSKIIVCVTSDILSEYSRVVYDISMAHPEADANRLLELLILQTDIYPNAYLDMPVSRDRDDDKFIACALEANAKVIISGDKDLLDLKSYRDIEIVTAREFVERYQL